MSVALPIRSPGARRRLVILAVAVANVWALAACGSSSSPTPPLSPAIATLSPTENPSPSAAPTATSGLTPTSWPLGWADQFCTLFAEVKIVQELVVDVERALAEDADGDALGLAQELAITAEGAQELLGQLGAWPPADPAVASIGALLEAARPISRAYVRFLTDDRQRSLRRARELAADTRPTVAEANEALADLAERGVSCVSGELVLESP